jgi:hypothetical protein
MRPVSLLPFCTLFLISCSEGPLPDDTDSETDTDQEVDTGDTDADSGGPVYPYPSSFPGGKYRVTKLQLATEADTDDDGVIDNNLANIFGMIDLLITTEDLSTLAFNERMQSNLDEWLTNVLIEAENEQGVIDYMLYRGIADSAFNLTIDPESLDESGNALVQLTGAFATEQGFTAGPGNITVPVNFISEIPTVQVEMEQALFDGVLTEQQTAGVLTGALPVDALLEQVIEPMIDEQGADINGDGVLETKEEIMALVEGIAPAAGDVDLGEERTGVSARFSFIGVPASF